MLNKEKREVLYLGRKNLSNDTSWLQSSPGGHETVMCLGSKGGQQHLGLYWQKHGQQTEGSDYCPLLSTREITSGILCPVLVLTVQEKCQLSLTEGNQDGCKIKTAISEDDKNFNEMTSMGMCTTT